MSGLAPSMHLLETVSSEPALQQQRFKGLIWRAEGIHPANDANLSRNTTYAAFDFVCADLEYRSRR